jgi:ribosomal protein S18 acetylase RimI-like enzyme
MEHLEQALRNSSHLVTAREGGRLVGLARCVSDDTSIAYVQDILVDPGYQQRGIGRALLQDCLDRYEHVRQKVLITDDRADQLRFYKSLGFANTRELVEMPINAFVIIGDLELR